MSGCGCGQPIITSAPAVPRVDVEAVLLCDVMPDGTVAATVLVEPVYDTSSGARVGTRTVDPATGAAYTVQGTLTDCAASGDDCDQFIGALCYQEPTTQAPSFTLHKFDAADPNYPGCLVGLDALDGDLPFIQYNDPITAWEGTYTSNTGTASNVEVSAPELGGFIDWSQFSPPIPSVPNAGLPAPYTGTAVFNGITVTLDVLTASAITTGTQYLRMGGTEHFKLSFSSPVTMKFGTQGFADPAAGNFERFCGVTATGAVTGAGEIRTAYGLRDCTTGETTWRDQVTGDPVDLTQAVVVPCPRAERDCASPTEPTATVGLCLADGTPIAVTVIRDCAGTVTSEGWLNLSTGAYSAGAPPAGTVACGDSRSIQVSGTFCAVDDTTGDVVALVLIEYSYDDTGAIEAVRLVDAVTGTTYTPPTGVTVTTCPTGTEQPEQDAVVLCDVQADGTIVQFVRDYRRDETGAIVGHTDYRLDGTPYPATTGTVGVCQPQTCRDCETLVLCDVPTAAPVTITGTAASGTLSNGVGWTATGSGNTTPQPPNMSNADGSWWGTHIFPHPVTGATKWTFSRPSTVEFSVYVHYYAPNPSISWAQLPPGLEVVHLPDGYTYNDTTGVLTRTAEAVPADPCSYVTDPRIASSARFRTSGAVTSVTVAPAPNSRIALCGQFFTYWAGAVSVVPGGPFLRHICRTCDGTPTVTNTLLDGITAYVPAGTVGVCEPSDEPAEVDVEPLLLCDTDTAGTVTQFLRHYVYDGSTGALDSFRDTGLDGSTPYAPSTGGTVGQCQPVECELTPICVRPSGRVEFLSNPGAATSGVDADWTWGQSLAGPWFPTYRVGVYPGWTTVDPGTAEGTAHWIAPHPDSQLANTGQPGEGPAITAGTPDWYGRASFQLPSFADPATIRISATALNADQLAVEWRLNGGAWQPVNSSHTAPPYTLAPTAVPGAQAGVNEIIVHVRETVFPTGAAGILLHVIAEYDVDASAYLQWTQVVCTDGTMYYLDDLGVRQDAIPDGATVVPCPGATESCAKAVIERCGCDDTDGDGIGDVTYTELWAVDPCGGGAPELLGTFLDGDLTQPYTPVAPVECTAAESLPGPLSTGVRAVTGTAAQDIAAAFPGLQSVSLTVLAGTVNVTMSDGAAVPIPAGVTMTWSVAQDSDTALAAASFTGAAAGASYLLNWTYR